MSKIKVLVVDDSSIMRRLLSEIINSHDNMEVIATAPDPYIAREKLVTLKPDIITLDIEMPKMDGITFLTKVMAHMPTRTVIISSLSQKGSQLALSALEAGAIDVIAKPVIDIASGIEEMAEEIRDRIYAAATSKLSAATRMLHSIPKSNDSKISLQSSRLLTSTTEQLIVIAASTGGTEALKQVLSQLPANIPGTLVVQHMPPVFTKTFAQNLNSICKFEVKEAEDKDVVRGGRVLLAPGNFHMTLKMSGAKFFIELNQDDRLHGVRPAADPLFFSVAQTVPKSVIGVILTGMGKDGALGLKAIHDAGGKTIAQDEATSVVFGMPKEAIKIGAIDIVLPIDEIAKYLTAEISKRDKAKLN